MEARPRTPPEHLGVRGGGRTTSCGPDIVRSPIKEGTTVTDDIDDIPEDTTVTEGVVAVAMVVGT